MIRLTEALEVINSSPNSLFIPCDSSGKPCIEDWRTKALWPDYRQLREWTRLYPGMSSLAVVNSDGTYEICCPPARKPVPTPIEAPVEAIPAIENNHALSAEAIDAAAPPPAVIAPVVVPPEAKPSKRPRKRVEDNVMRYRRRYIHAYRTDRHLLRLTKEQSFEREMLLDIAWANGGYLDLEYDFLARQAHVDPNDVTDFARFKKQLLPIILFDFVVDRVKKILFSQALADDYHKADKSYNDKRPDRSKGGFATAERKDKP